MGKWYEIENADSVDSPCLAVYPQRVTENIRRLISMVDDVSRIRPHIKTHKTAEGIGMMMAAGIRKFKCATIAEAELLGICGAPDVVLAYQPHGPKLLRFVKVIQAYPGTRYACLTDNIRSAESMSAVFQAAGIEVPVYIDINAGMNRSGIAPGEDVIRLYTHCASLPGLVPAGLHVYDGHHRQPDIEARRKSCDLAFEPLWELSRLLADKFGHDPVIIAGGSPTFPIHARRREVECSPGTCIFWDKGYADICPEQPFEPAAVLLTRVISLPAADRVCLDLGHKSVAAENDIARRIYFPDAPYLTPVSQSEEHLVMATTEPHALRPGDLLYGIPYHICPTVALYDSLRVVEQRVAEGEWKVRARDRKLNI